MPDDAPRLGRSVEVDMDHTETLTENNQHYTTWEVANILKIPKSVVIGENEKCVFYFTEKKEMDFLANPIVNIRKRITNNSSSSSGNKIIMEEFSFQQKVQSKARDDSWYFALREQLTSKKLKEGGKTTKQTENWLFTYMFSKNNARI